MIYYIIHIGKCGGGSLQQELRKNKKDFGFVIVKNLELKKNLSI